MGRRIILVDFTWTRDKDPRIPLGHASLLASLRANTDVDTRSLVVPVNVGNVSPSAVAHWVLNHIEDVNHKDVDVALGAYVWGEGLLRKVIACIRAAGFEGRIILGGPQISYSGAGLERLYPDVDAFVRGYGEQVLCELVAWPDHQEIVGVHFAGTRDCVGQANVVLDSLPSPWLTGTISLAGQRFIRWETQRGCPFRCAFCQHREAGARLLRRAMGSARIAAEIDLFCQHEVQDIAVLDPIFNASSRSTAILQRFAGNGFRGRLSLQCRAEMVTDAFLDAAQALNVRLEFGLQTVHRSESEAVQRRNNIPRVDAALAVVRKRGIDHEVSLIFGLPMQTLRSFEESVRWCLDREVPVIKAFPLLLLRGTGLDRDRSRWGLVTDGSSMPIVVESSTFTGDDWLAMSRLSEALRQTEGRHPTGLPDLVRRSADCRPALARWQPRVDGARQAAHVGRPSIKPRSDSRSVNA